MTTDKISPFTQTPGIAGKALIKTHYSDEIIENFLSSDSYKYIYKIVGLRGSGKSVEYSLVMEYFRKQKNWLVYPLSSGGNPIATLISLLSKEDFIDDKLRNISLGLSSSLGGNIAILSANAQTSAAVNIADNHHYYSDEATLRDMLKKACLNKYRILIGIDDIAKSKEMVRFLSILGSILLESDIDIRFVCTGLSKNIEDFVNEAHLSFFVRNESIVIKPLDLHQIAQKYKSLLDITKEEAIALARFTKGYAYAYQLLGEICFKLRKSSIDAKVEEEFDAAIGSQYDLIWSTLTTAEQDLIKVIISCNTTEVSDIKNAMAHPSSFASLRDRLIKKHMLISEDRGHIEIPLPRFDEYIKLWKFD